MVVKSYFYAQYIGEDYSGVKNRKFYIIEISSPIGESGPGRYLFEVRTDGFYCPYSSFETILDNWVLIRKLQKRKFDNKKKFRYNKGRLVGK